MSTERILFIPDTHLPFIDWDALAFVSEFARSYKPTRIVQLGDLIDAINWSKFLKAPDSPNAEAEWCMTESAVRAFHSKFRKDIPWTIIEGNHCRRYLMRACEANIPKQLVKTLEQMFPFENWQWHMSPQPYMVNKNTMAIHGDEFGGSPIQKARISGLNVFQGHIHSGSLEYVNQGHRQIFAVSCGALLDKDSIAARYSAKHINKSWLGCATLTDGVPQLHPYA